MKKQFQLRAYHYRAMQLRLYGYKYPRIAIILSQEFSRSIRPQTVNWWFKSEGLLDKEYKDFKYKALDHPSIRFARIEIGKLASAVAPLLLKYLTLDQQPDKEKLTSLRLTALFMVIKVLGLDKPFPGEEGYKKH